MHSHDLFGTDPQVVGEYKGMRARCGVASQRVSPGWAMGADDWICPRAVRNYWGGIRQRAPIASSSGREPLQSTCTNSPR